MAAETYHDMDEVRRIWLEGIAPQFSDVQLETLLQAVREDNCELGQRNSMWPLPSFGVNNPTVIATCAICYAGWKNTHRRQYAQVCEWMNEVIVGCAQRLNSTTAAHDWIEWYDSVDRTTMRLELAEQIEQALEARARKAAHG